MAQPGSSNPLGYVIQRTVDDRIVSCRSILQNRLKRARSLYRKDIFAHFGCVNAIEFSSEGELLISGGDDRRVLLWKVEKAMHGVGKPVAMHAEHSSNIFCLSFDSTNSKIFSAGNDEQVIVHDTKTGEPIDYFLHEEPVYGLSIDPLNDNVFASACDDGKILIFDIRESPSEEPFCLANYESAFHAVMFNPVEPRLVTSANAKEGIGLWDIRKPHTCVMRYGGNHAIQSCMSVRFNRMGTRILALRRRLPPVLYALNSPSLLCQFDHPGYYNSCTMKSCCFAGDQDDYLLSGSDDFNLYMWRIPPPELGVRWVDRAHMVLKGHRSIVNQVRFNYSNHIIASSGVEKLVKFWSPFQLPDSSGNLNNATHEDKVRKVYTHEEYISLVLRSGQIMTHDYSHQSTHEDPRMMAFFDSLVQREIEGWTSEDSVTSENSEDYLENNLQGTVATSPSGSDSAHSDADANEGNSAQHGPLAAAAFADAVALGRVAHQALSTAASSQLTSQQPKVNGDEVNETTNRITQLIARKRAQLMRLARARLHSEQRQKFRRRRRLDSIPTQTEHSEQKASASSSDSDGETEGIRKRKKIGGSCNDSENQIRKRKRRKCDNSESETGKKSDSSESNNSGSSSSSSSSSDSPLSEENLRTSYRTLKKEKNSKLMFASEESSDSEILVTDGKKNTVTKTEICNLETNSGCFSTMDIGSSSKRLSDSAHSSCKRESDLSVMDMIVSTDSERHNPERNLGIIHTADALKLKNLLRKLRRKRTRLLRGVSDTESSSSSDNEGPQRVFNVTNGSGNKVPKIYDKGVKCEASTSNSGIYIQESNNILSQSNIKSSEDNHTDLPIASNPVEAPATPNGKECSVQLVDTPDSGIVVSSNETFVTEVSSYSKIGHVTPEDNRVTETNLDFLRGHSSTLEEKLVSERNSNAKSDSNNYQNENFVTETNLNGKTSHNITSSGTVSSFHGNRSEEETDMTASTGVNNSSVGNNNNNVSVEGLDSESEWVRFKQFKKKIERNGRNYRNYIGLGDSDSS